MKTLKLTVLTLALFACSFAAKANTDENDNPAGQYRAINTYVDAMTRGRISGFDKVIDNTAKFSFLRNNQIVSFSKTQMIDFIKENQTNEQACIVSTSLVSSNADVAVVKVDQKYEGFVRTNYVTLTNNGADWKITDVYSVFK